MCCFAIQPGCTSILSEVQENCRAGLYKQLSVLKAVVDEYRENPVANASLKGSIVQSLTQAGLEQECPLQPAKHTSAEAGTEMSKKAAEEIPEADFTEWVGRVYLYLQVRGLSGCQMSNAACPW